MRSMLVRTGLVAVLVVNASSLERRASADGNGHPPRTATSGEARVGLDHVQLRAIVSYKPTGDKGKEITRWYLRFKEPKQQADGYLAPKPGETVPDQSVRFFSDVVGDSLVECYFGSHDEISGIMSLSSVYCLQTANADGSGYGVYIEASAACDLRPGATGGGRTHFTLFNENHVVAGSTFMLGLDCEAFDTAGTLPPAPKPAPSAARTSLKRAPAPRASAPKRPVPTASDEGHIVSAANDETFMIETNGDRHVFKTKTYCFGINDGDTVVFAENPSVCVTNTFIDRTNGTSCEVWCE